MTYANKGESDVKGAVGNPSDHQPLSGSGPQVQTIFSTLTQYAHFTNVHVIDWLDTAGVIQSCNIRIAPAVIAGSSSIS